MYNQAVGRIDTCQLETPSPEWNGECTPHWSWVECQRASKLEDPSGQVDFPGWFWNMVGSSMAASMFLVSVGRHRVWRQCFWTIARWTSTWYLGGISDFPMCERDKLPNACQETCSVSRTGPWKLIEWDDPSRREQWACTAQCSSSTTGSAILSSSWPSLWFEEVSNQVFGG